MTEVLVLYYSRGGSTARMARAVARGIEAAGVGARLRTVPPVAPETETASPAVPESGSPYATLDDLRECQGLVLGSPTRFGNMAAPLKYFLDTSGELWINGTLNGRPAGVFTSTGSLHGGQELTLMTMMIPLLHHGMVLVGMDSMAPALNRTRAGGTPYGASHWAGGGMHPNVLDPDEMALCESLGERVARLAERLA
ncbi:NAD(P)H:quinone oxidoreductase [Polycyclovorans algicola]|uniref:NAD(P)H:quinone oxidoreductase n=1 Tax=Polycyclovorans algicola TaxID=616992 RepID=UPI0004A7354A|nr:NAD(P)H:quinone oxidoreductase [Polycyclovorans algicola]